MKLLDLRLTGAAALLSLLSALAAPVGYAQAQSIPITDQPLFTTAGVPPLMMMVMSRDEQLFNKAYPDYTDLDPENNNGIDTTYIDTFDYSGYFDPKLCYSYGSSKFTASAKATGTNSHQCSSAWSGNFLNWAAMSRIDLLRFVLYGGNRSTDDASTVLERAYIPNDLHAWAKVYRGSDVAQFVPGASGPVTLCSASFGASGAGDPILRVASGDYPEWAATALSQCNWRETVYSAGNGNCSGAAGDNSCWDDAPKSAALGGTAGDYTVRVQVCGTDATKRESFCQKYTDTSGAASYKPVGLLQNYGESGKLRFGLISGSYSKPRSGGVLRRNIGKFAGNGTGAGCATGDEVNLSNGRFCNQTDGTEGIVNTIKRFKLTQWNGSNNWSDCNTYGILNRDGDKHLNNPGTQANSQNCSGWGNPLSEMYAEAVRYISKETKTTGFSASGDLSGLPAPDWLDPYRAPAQGGNPYCANCSILVLASGLNSFDGDEVPTVASLQSSAAALTGAVGDKESVNGQDLVGRSIGHLVDPASAAAGPKQTDTNTHVDLCTAKTVTSLGDVRGICPDIPSMEGSYLMAGLAYKAWTTDLRPNLTNSRGEPKPVDSRNTVQTYAVALAENLPKFEIPIGNNKIALAPLCQANNSGSADGLGGTNDTAWRSCFLGSVSIGSKTSTQDRRYVYGRALESNASAGSFSLVWEDSLWGNDHDNDVVSMLTYCVGDACSRSTGLPTTTAQELCWYTSTNYGSGRTCPNTASGDNLIAVRVRSVKVASGYTLKLCTGSNGTGTCSSYTANNGNIDVSTKSYVITGGVVPPPSTASYSGFDICWRAKGTGTDADASPVCGSDGRPTVRANDVLIRIENLSAYAGNAMLTGYAVTGSNADGLKRLTLRPGNTNGSILTQTLEPDSNWYKPMVLKFSAGTSSAKQLENPLFYSAKYGGFTTVDANTHKRRPPRANEWPNAAPSEDWAPLDADGHPTSVPNNYFLVRNPAKLKEQLQKVFESIIAGSSPSGSVAASASRFTVGQTLAYQSSYDSSGWVGDLKAFQLNADGSLGGEQWSAAGKLPAGARNTIWVGVPSGSSGYRAQQFTGSNLTTAMQTALAGSDWPNTTNSINSLVAYLKGAQDNEEPGGAYRKRETAKRLGDIVNSSPQVGYKISYGYNMLQPSPGCDQGCIDAYQTHVDAKPTTVFVGANDGMLHAFAGAANGGQELFAYVPNAVIPKLGKLAKPSYAHTYFVDGTPALGDAFLGAWKTVLVGSAGAGARSVFALNVTTPSAFGGNDLLFELNDQTDADMGQFVGTPSPPTLTADGKWVTAFGNGYNGASNKAKLFVIDLATGTPRTVDAITDAANAAPNGLSTATIVDGKGNCPATGESVCSDGIGDTIYAGDYRGNVWKFVLSENRWRLSPSTPIFKAVDTYGHQQPITSGMFAVKNPLGGVIVYFGTGKYLDIADNDPYHLEADNKPLVNSLYAIWDNNSGTPVTRDDLQEQKVTAYNASSGLWTMTQNAFGYRSTDYSIGKMGWFLDLTLQRNAGDDDPLSGERVVAAPVGLLSKLFVNVFRPSGEICLPAGVNSLLELDLLNGSAAFPSESRGFGGNGGGTGPGGQNIGNGPPLNSPNPVITIPGHTGIPAIGCPPGTPDCVANPRPYCTPDVPGYPNCPCANPNAPPGTPSTDPQCDPPSWCHPGDPGYPLQCGGTEANQRCTLLPNPGVPGGSQGFQCRASWRQLR